MKTRLISSLLKNDRDAEDRINHVILYLMQKNSNYEKQILKEVALEVTEDIIQFLYDQIEEEDIFESNKEY